MNQGTGRVEKDKVGEELVAQRFGMLADIARELNSGEVLFPTCFDTVLRLRKELQNPDISFPRLAQIVQLDPLVAAKLMRLANSVAYSPNGQPVRDLPSAINRLGINVVRSTAMAVAMGAILHAKELVGFAKLARALWEHSIYSAAATRLLAHVFGQTRSEGKIRSEEALLAGLVHDLGAFYMLYRTVQYPELRERPDTVRHLIAQWHEAIGVTLLETLRLPREISQAAADHDHLRPIPDDPRTLADVVYVSNFLAGGVCVWLDLDHDDARAKEVEYFREKYASLLPEIEADAHGMQSALE